MTESISCKPYLAVNTLANLRFNHLNYLPYVPVNQIIMGRGDKKTKKGKISMGTFGVRRPKKGGGAPKPKTEKK